MKKINIAAMFCICLVLCNCNEDKLNDKIVFATSADYPPFEYISNREVVGFEIELAKMIAKEIGKKAEFKDMQFSSILAAIKNNIADAGIATISVTEERGKNFDFSEPYYDQGLSIVFLKEKALLTVSELSGKKIACQLGTSAEIWLKKHSYSSHIITNDNNIQAIETLKAGYVDGVIVDETQAVVFAKNNPQLGYGIIAKLAVNFSIVFKKGSKLKDKVNNAINILKANGTIEKLKNKYLNSGYQ